MKKKFTIILALMLFLSLNFSTNLNPVYAIKSLKDIQQEIQDKKDQLKVGKKKAGELTDEIKDLEVKIGIAENRIAELEVQVQKTTKKIEITKEELKKAEEEVQTQSENLNVRLRTMYKNGSIGFLDVLLGSNNITEFISNLDLLKKVYASDKEVLAALKKQYAIIEEKKNALTALEKQLKEEKSSQAQKKKELEQNKKMLAKKKSAIVGKNKDLEDNIADLRGEEDRIRNIINNEKNKNKGGGGGKVGTGQFTWPVPGHSRVSSDYGWRICPFHGKEFHTGIDIPAPYGTSVVAADSGTVIFAGYLGSYGNAVLISHGSSLYTLYAHNSSIVTWSGGVSKGQTISRIGSTGSSTGNHLHFEVRKGGSSYGSNVSPWNYL